MVKRILIGDTYSYLNTNNKIYTNTNKSHYTILRNGDIIDNGDIYYKDEEYSNIIKNSIVILFENMGILKSNDDFVYDMFGNKINDKDVFKIKWKQEELFQKYTEKQYKSFNLLINELFVKHSNIDKNIISNNTKIKEMSYHTYSGILCFSNISSNFYDVNPSFEYDKIII